MPISNPPEAPPPPDGPILNTKDHELEIIPNSKYIDELDNPGKKRKAVISRKNAFKAKKLLQSTRAITFLSIKISLLFQLRYQK